MANLAETWRAAAELATGTGRKSVKRALWASILSIEASLDINARQYQIVLQWDTTGLPEDREDVYRAIQGNGKFRKTQRDALYFAEKLERDGLLTGLENIGRGPTAQDAWRKKMHDLWHPGGVGMGMSWKTLSFAAIILDPLHCHLVPVDRHVIDRLNLPDKGSPQSYKRYKAIEDMVRVERDTMGRKRVPLAIHHWHEWDSHRLAKGANKLGKIESHARLSCWA